MPQNRRRPVASLGLMYGAFIFMGALFGVALSLTLGVFYALSLEGAFKANLRAVAGQVRDRLTGRRRYLPQVDGERRVESDTRIRSLQEELRMANRLLDQARGEREAHGQQSRAAADQTQQLQKDVIERDARMLALEEELRQHGPRLQALREQLAARSAELAQARRELKDLQVELDVLSSGSQLLGRG